jgi:hypothetical protein
MDMNLHMEMICEKEKAEYNSTIKGKEKETASAYGQIDSKHCA